MRGMWTISLSVERLSGQSTWMHFKIPDNWPSDGTDFSPSWGYWQQD